MRRLSAQQGFTLVEVMVTVFVVAVGLLAAAALQAVSKKAALDAMQRSTATVLAQDMVERVRANRAQLAAYHNEEISSAEGETPAAAACGGGNGSSDCTPAQLVNYDLHAWWQSLDGVSETITTGSGASAATSNVGGLRTPTGCINVSERLLTVAVAWRGMSEIKQGDESAADDPTNNACGKNRADYELSGSKSYRRILVLQAVIAPL